MQTKLVALAALSVLIPGLIPATARAEDPKGDVAWDIVAGLTTEIGQRLAGSPREAAARAWAKARLEKLGFVHVTIEPFPIKGYVRGTDAAMLTAPVPQHLAVAALGYSGTTPATGIEAEMVYFRDLDDLKAAPAGSLAGKIAFIDHAMRANQDGSGYGPYGQVRRAGPSIAASKGAVGVVIRSAGTDHNRDPHTGATTWAAGIAPVPAGALSNPDADLIARTAGLAAKLGKSMRLTLTLTGHTQDGLPSGNVIGELPGRDLKLTPILVGCHLDSWDLATGAIDNAAGCAIVTAAALKAQAGGQNGKERPLRTIRVLWAGSEELGGFGGLAYAKNHARELHALAMESDFGADRVWKAKINLAPADKPLADAVIAALNPMGIVAGVAPAQGGTDVEPIIVAQHLAVIDMAQDGTRYFDLHHTPDDTLDKIDPAQLAQNVDAWTAVLKVLANAPVILPITAAAQ